MEIIELGRDDLEQNSSVLIDESESKDISILVPGDPMVATTHIILIEEARKRGINTKIIHNASILSAICETGMHAYKFGATATVPFLEKTGGELPMSVYKTLKLNKSNGLHTLLLLDIADGKGMTAAEAMETLLELERMEKDNVFNHETKVVVFARAGHDDSIIKYGKVGDLKETEFGKSPMVIIVPGNLHFSEEEYLLTLK